MKNLAGEPEREMVQHLRTLAVLAEDVSSVPSIHIRQLTESFSLTESNPSAGLH